MAVLSAEGATPTMAQWFRLKADNPDALLFLRMGDFYELFFADAEAAAAALDIALTRRGEHAGQPIPMCGVPVHAAEAYLARLIRRGFRVAVAEQMEAAKARAGKAPLRREIVRLVTPGTLTEDSLLDAHRPNLLLSTRAARRPAGRGVARRVHRPVRDRRPGRRRTARAARPARARRDPGAARRSRWATGRDGAARRRRRPAPLAARQRVAEAFGAASLDAFGTFTDAEAVAAALALDYVRTTQAGTLPRLSRPVPAGLAGQMMLDAATRASLEIARARDGGAAHTLLAAVDRTLDRRRARGCSAAWLGGPLLDPAAIAARQDGWSWLLLNPGPLAALRDGAARRAGPGARARAGSASAAARRATSAPCWRR